MTGDGKWSKCKMGQESVFLSVSSWLVSSKDFVGYFVYLMFSMCTSELVKNSRMLEPNSFDIMPFHKNTRNIIDSAKLLYLNRNQYNDVLTKIMYIKHNNHE